MGYGMWDMGCGMWVTREMRDVWTIAPHLQPNSLNPLNSKLRTPLVSLVIRH